MASGEPVGQCWANYGNNDNLLHVLMSNLQNEIIQFSFESFILNIHFFKGTKMCNKNNILTKDVF